jgi:hypothetical protein
MREEYTLRVFKNRVVMRIFGHKREEVAEEDCIMRSFLYFSPNIIWVMKSRRIRWAGHVAHSRDELYFG